MNLLSFDVGACTLKLSSTILIENTFCNSESKYQYVAVNPVVLSIVKTIPQS